MSTIEVGGRELTIGHLDKVFYPDAELTKGDVVEYYRRVADTMVTHLRGRPLTLRRYPEGIDAEGWFQKEASQHFPDWVRVESMVQRGNDGSVRHVVCDDPATLVYLAGQATLEFHVWTSTVDKPDNPDLLVLDLDPPDGTELSELRNVARRVRDLFDELGLTPFLQATGGRGYHLVTPLDQSADFDEVREFARAAADHLAAQDPDRLTTAQRKVKRGDRIFLDTNRNGYAQTFVTPYSLRARPSAAVAAPLDWSELGKTRPDAYGPKRMLQRLARKQDPWRDLHTHAASIAEARARLDAKAG